MSEFWKYESQEGIMETLKKIFKTGGTLLFCGILIFLLIKTFYLNSPKLSAEEVAISYLKAEQNLERETAEQYLSSDFEKVEILGEKYENLRKIKWLPKEQKGEDPIFETKDAKVEGNQASIDILEKTNKKENQPFFNFLLPKEIAFEMTLEKQGSWKNGYQWKIIKVDSSDLVLESKIGEQIEIAKGIFAKPIKIEEYSPKNVKLPKGIKILSLEIEYENKTKKSKSIYSFEEWSIVDKSGETLYSPPVTSAISLRKPVFLGQELKDGKTKKGYVVFEVPKDISPEKIEKVIFKNMEKKIIFNFQ